SHPWERWSGTRPSLDAVSIGRAHRSLGLWVVMQIWSWPGHEQIPKNRRAHVERRPISQPERRWEAGLPLRAHPPEHVDRGDSELQARSFAVEKVERARQFRIERAA